MKLRRLIQLSILVCLTKLKFDTRNKKMSKAVSEYPPEPLTPH